VVPGTDSPFQWANLPTFSNNHRLFPMYKEGTNMLPAMQPVSHFTEMSRMSVHFPTMLLRFPGYYNTNLGITYGPDYNFATNLHFQFTFQSYGLPPYWQYQQGEKSVPAHFWMTLFDVSLTFHAQAQRFSRTDRMFDDDPSQLHAMYKDFGIRKYDEEPDLLASLFPVYPKVNHPSLLLNRIENPLLARLFPVSNHTIAQFPVHNNLPDDRLKKYKFEFENPAKQDELLAGVRQFQFQDVNYDLEHQHRIDIVVNRVRYIMMKFVMKFRT
jgi:hypothetical protein